MSIPVLTSSVTTRSTIAQMSKSARVLLAPASSKPVARYGSKAGIIPGANPQGNQPSAISAVSEIIAGPTAASTTGGCTGGGSSALTHGRTPSDPSPAYGM